MKKSLLIIAACLLVCLSVSAKRVGVYCFWADNGQHLYEDESVKIVLTVDNNSPVLAILNKTDDVVYVDRGNTFVYTNGQPQTLFKNTSTTSSNTDMGGASLNLGGLAGALGIGGVAGGILGGTTVGGGNASTQGTTVYETRVLAIAPKSVTILFKWVDAYIFFNPNLIECGTLVEKRDRFINPQTGEKVKVEIGMTRHYDENMPLLYLKGNVKYSKLENMDAAKSATVTNYITDVVIDSFKGIKDMSYPLPYCQPYQGKSLYKYKSGVGWAATPAGLNAVLWGSGLIAGGIFVAVWSAGH